MGELQYMPHCPKVEMEHQFVAYIPLNEVQSPVTRPRPNAKHWSFRLVQSPLAHFKSVEFPQINPSVLNLSCGQMASPWHNSSTSHSPNAGRHIFFADSGIIVQLRQQPSFTSLHLAPALRVQLEKQHGLFAHSMNDIKTIIFA
jgi:hypothetical protein